jgi:hypothetical protein
MVAIQLQLFGCYLMEGVMAFPDRVERTADTEGWAKEPGQLVAQLDAA